MKFLIQLCLIFCLASFASLPLDKFEQLKEKIINLEAGLENCQSENEKSALYYKIAKSYLEDQEQELGFKNFLLAIKYAQTFPLYKISAEEKELYQKVETEYFSKGNVDPYLASTEFLEKFGKLVSEKKDFLKIQLLISTAYANVGDYERFFETFYRSYPFLWDTFLSYKTQGILYLRLAQKCRFEKERQELKEEALKLLHLALERYPKDPGLYRILIFHAKDEKNETSMLSYLQKMIESKAAIPRGDIYLYVREAVFLEEYEMAQRIIDHATELYNYSRAVSAAQGYLNQHKGA